MALVDRSRSGRRRRHIAVTLALTLVFGACGGDDDSDSAAQGKGATSEEAGTGTDAETSTPSQDQNTPPAGGEPAPAAGEPAPGAAAQPGAGAAAAPSAPAGKPAAPQPATGTKQSAAAKPAGGSGAAGPAPAAGGAAAGPSGSDPAKGGATGPSGGAEAPKPDVPAPAAPGGDVPAASGGVIKVGGVFPLSGPLGTFGRTMSDAMKTIFTESNEKGGIGGAKFQFIIYDDQFDPAQGKRYTRELINKNIFAFAGFTPGTYEAVKEDLWKAGIPGIPMDVGAERQRQDKFAFPPYAGCLRIQAGTIKTAMERGHKKFAFIELDIEAVHRCMDYSEAIIKKLGGEVVYRGSVAPGAPDCAPQVLAARGADPEVVVPFMEPLGMLKCLQAKKQQGWDADWELGMPGGGDTAMIKVLGEYAEGLSTVTPWALPGSPEWEAACGGIRKYFSDSSLSIYTTIGCVSAIVLVSALTALGPDASRAELMQYLESGTPIDTRGVTPPITYKPGDHRPFDLVAPAEIKNGKWVITGPYFTPPRLTDDIKDGD